MCVRLALAALFIAALAPACTAQPTGAPDAGALLSQTAATYGDLDAYHVAATVTLEMTSPAGSQAMDLRVEIMRRGADAFRAEVESDMLSLIAVGRADSSYLYLPDTGHYMRRAGTLRLGDPAFPVPDLLEAYARLDVDVDTAWVARAETVEVGGASHAAWVVEIDYAPRPSAAGTDSTHKTLWIDQARHLVLRDQTRARTADSPFGGPAMLVEETVFTHVEADAGFSDDRFAFDPPADAAEVSPDVFLGGMAGGGTGLVGTPAEDFTLTTLDGETMTLSSLRGQTVLVNFWATWCGPCRMEMPALDALYQAHADDGFVVLAVDLGETAEEVRAYIAQYGYTFPVLLDTDAAVGDAYGAMAIPVSVIVGPDGIITHHFEGAQTEEVFRDALREVGIE